MKRLLATALLVLAAATHGVAATRFTVTPQSFGMDFTHRQTYPVFSAADGHWGGTWSFVASCRPTNPTNPADACYNWTNLDLGLAFGQANGYALQYNMGYAPGWSNGSQGTQVPPTNPQDYFNWSTAYFTRYPAGKIATATVWNEVQDKANGTGYNGSLSNLITLENGLCPIVHSLSPTTKVLAPNTYGASGLTYHVNYFAAGGGQCPDAFSWHSYPVGDPNNLEQWDNTTRFYQALLAATPLAGKPIYVTEGGYANATSDPVAMGSLWPLFMECMVGPTGGNAQAYAWDRAPGGNTGLDYWLDSAHPNDSNGRGIGYKTMQSWLIGATITQCPTRAAGTNMIRNPTGTGITAGTLGSGGALPTNWSYNSADSAYGVSAAVVGSCTNGVSIRVWTPTTVQSGASGSMTFAFEGNNQVLGTLGKQMNIGASVSLVAGSMTNLGAQFAANTYTSGNGYLSSPMGASNAPVVPIATPVAWNWKATIPDATAAYVIPKFGVSYSVGASFDATFCIASVSADTGSQWTALITRPGGYVAMIAWDSAGGPTAFTVPGLYPWQRDATNNLTPVAANSVSTLAQAPRLFESAPWGGFAPADAPNYPNLLAGYAYKPGWQVAGVDYFVGVSPSKALKDPATMSIPGAEVDLANHRIVVDNSVANVLIDGYDFSLNGGWYVLNWTNTGTLTIQNSKFAVGSNHRTPIDTYADTGNITILASTFEGNFDPDTSKSAFIVYNGAGTLTIRNNWFKHSSGDVIDINSHPTNLIAEYNLFEDTGMAGAHGDLTQFLGAGPYTATIRYNTVKQAAGLSSQGFMVEPDNGAILGVINGGEIAYNTLTGAITYFTGVTVADLTGPFSVHDNYYSLAEGAFGFTPGGVRGGYNDGNPGSAYTNNVNMTDGALYQDTPAGTP